MVFSKFIHMKKIFLLIFTISILYSCSKVTDNPTPSDVVVTMDNLVVNPSFNFKTTQNISVELKAQDNLGTAMQYIRFNVISNMKENDGVIIASGATDINGDLKLSIPLPSYYDSIVVATDFIGFVNQIKLPIIGGKVSCSFGGNHPAKKSAEELIPKATAAYIKFLGTYNNQGVPNYLVSNDVVEASLLTDINTWLPEYKSVPINHSGYLAQTNVTNVILNQMADVWVTFVHEGAGYMNVLGFYTYNKNTPITNVSQIDSIRIIFPNASLSGSGGGLNSGNRVKIGTFPANTGIGWVLFSNGWTGSSVNANATKYYSDPILNPETDVANRQHTVLLHDAGRGLYLCGFEDMGRNPSVGADNDFNDILFYVKTNPVQAISQSNVYQASGSAIDTDHDGISDLFDDYPTDPLRAFNNYFPSKTQFGSLTFEDLWPSKGDYDFNDVVVDYRFNPITNAANQIVNIQAQFIVRATGAGYSNGFGFQLPNLPSASVQSVTGTKLTENYITNLASGVEANQTNATIIVFDNAWRNFTAVAGSNPTNVAGINTYAGGKTGIPDTLNINIVLTQPISPSVIGLPPYNPFIIANKQRGKEIHMTDYPPTSLVDHTLFGTFNDNSNPSTGRYYRTVNNLPWGINIAEKFNYPVEKNQITLGYLKFASWAQSSGVLYKDWYKPNAGYRNSVYIYPN